MNEERNKIKEISKYISKDFSVSGITSVITNEDFNDLNGFKAYLSEKIRGMMETKFSQLMNTLYLIDVNEEKVNELFSSKNRDFIPEKLAELIIERQLQKYHLRQKHKRGEF